MIELVTMPNIAPVQARPSGRKLNTIEINESVVQVQSCPIELRHRAALYIIRVTAAQSRASGQKLVRNKYRVPVYSYVPERHQTF